eukprot:6185778-Pleurochrysis_carterae.AAC.1
MSTPPSSSALVPFFSRKNSIFEKNPVCPLSAAGTRTLRTSAVVAPEASRAQPTAEAYVCRRVRVSACACARARRAGCQRRLRRALRPDGRVHRARRARHHRRGAAHEEARRGTRETRDAHPPFALLSHVRLSLSLSLARAHAHLHAHVRTHRRTRTT